MRRSLLYALTGLLVLVPPFWGWALPSKAQSSGAEAPEPSVRKAASRALSAQYPESADHLKVRVRRVRGTLDPEAGLRLVFPGGEGRPTGLTQVDLRTRGAEGDWTTAGWALLHVARLDSVATLRTRAPRGAPIAPSDLETAWLETSSLHGEPLRADTAHTRAARGALVATRHLQSGRVLRARDVRRPYAADTGSALRVRYQKGRLVFRLSCTAREPGGVDDVIRVHCSGLNTMYRARITSKRTAQWVETL